MKERGILFSGPLVRALLAGTKTQTRRIMKPQPVWSPEWGTANGGAGAWIYGNDKDTGDRWSVVFDEDHQQRVCTQEGYGWGARSGCPYGVPGDRLWVRETWGLVSYSDPTFWRYGSIAGSPTVDLLDAWQVAYRADWGPNQEGCVWRSPLHMPRWASRITLEVTSVRVERLDVITEEDARAEGVEVPEGLTAVSAFALLWNRINGDKPGCSWSARPCVWVVGFKRFEATP